MKDQEKTTKKDVAHSLVKGGLGTIPVIGSLASEIFGLLITPPLERRRAEWMNELATRLKNLEEEKGLDLTELQYDDQFVDIVMQATTQALKTSEKEKIKAFQNTVLNTASGDRPEKAISQIFLNHIDSFTIWHVKILKLIDNPRKWYDNNDKKPPDLMAGSISHMIKDVFPELKGKDELLNIIWSDLKNAGFHNSGSLGTTMTGNGILAERTTKFGKDFLRFISIKE